MPKDNYNEEKLEEKSTKETNAIDNTDPKNDQMEYCSARSMSAPSLMDRPVISLPSLPLGGPPSDPQTLSYSISSFAPPYSGPGTVPNYNQSFVTNTSAPHINYNNICSLYMQPNTGAVYMGSGNGIGLGYKNSPTVFPLVSQSKPVIPPSMLPSQQTTSTVLDRANGKTSKEKTGMKGNSKKKTNVDEHFIDVDDIIPMKRKREEDEKKIEQKQKFAKNLDLDSLDSSPFDSESSSPPPSPHPTKLPITPLSTKRKILSDLSPHITTPSPFPQFTKSPITPLPTKGKTLSDVSPRIALSSSPVQTTFQFSTVENRLLEDGTLSDMYQHPSFSNSFFSPSHLLPTNQFSNYDPTGESLNVSSLFSDNFPSPTTPFPSPTTPMSPYSSLGTTSTNYLTDTFTETFFMPSSDNINNFNQKLGFFDDDNISLNSKDGRERFSSFNLSDFIPTDITDFFNFHGK
jgi:hypothetical protein